MGYIMAVPQKSTLGTHLIHISHVGAGFSTTALYNMWVVFVLTMEVNLWKCLPWTAWATKKRRWCHHVSFVRSVHDICVVVLDHFSQCFCHVLPSCYVFLCAPNHAILHPEAICSVYPSVCPWRLDHLRVNCPAFSWWNTKWGKKNIIFKLIEHQFFNFQNQSISRLKSLDGRRTRPWSYSCKPMAAPGRQRALGSWSNRRSSPGKAWPLPWSRAKRTWCCRWSRASSLHSLIGSRAWSWKTRPRQGHDTKNLRGQLQTSLKVFGSGFGLFLFFCVFFDTSTDFGFSDPVVSFGSLFLGVWHGRSYGLSRPSSWVQDVCFRWNICCPGPKHMGNSLLWSEFIFHDLLGQQSPWNGGDPLFFVVFEEAMGTTQSPGWLCYYYFF